MQAAVVFPSFVFLCCSCGPREPPAMVQCLAGLFQSCPLQVTSFGSSSFAQLPLKRAQAAGERLVHRGVV